MRGPLGIYTSPFSAASALFLSSRSQRFRGGVEDRLAGAVFTPRLAHKPLFEKGADSAVRAHAANAGDRRARDGLIVGDDRKRLQGGL